METKLTCPECSETATLVDHNDKPIKPPEMSGFISTHETWIKTWSQPHSGNGYVSALTIKVTCVMSGKWVRIEEGLDRRRAK